MRNKDNAIKAKYPSIDEMKKHDEEEYLQEDLDLEQQNARHGGKILIPLSFEGGIFLLPKIYNEPEFANPLHVNNLI